jgi:hypothetical protein
MLPDKPHWLIALVGVGTGVAVGSGSAVGVAEGTGAANMPDGVGIVVGAGSKSGAFVQLKSAKTNSRLTSKQNVKDLIRMGSP